MPLLSTRGGGSARGFGMFGLVQAPNPITTNLQLFYDFNNPSSYSGSGSTVNDISGNGRNGTIVGSPTFITSPSKGLDFNSSVGSQEINFNNPVDFNGNWTAEFWFTTGGNDWDWIMNMNNYNSGFTFATNALVPRWSYGTWFTEAVTGTRPTLTLGQSYQIVFQKSGTNTLTFLNGSQIGNTTSISGQSVTNSTCYIGRGPSGGDRFNGNLFITRIYNSVLSASDVLQNFNANRGRFGI